MTDNDDTARLNWLEGRVADGDVNIWGATSGGKIGMGFRDTGTHRMEVYGDNLRAVIDAAAEHVADREKE